MQDLKLVELTGMYRGNIRKKYLCSWNKE